MNIFFLWRRPAQLDDSRATLVFYLWGQPAQLDDGLRNTYLIIFDESQRNLATARAICLLQVIRNWARPV